MRGARRKGGLCEPCCRKTALNDEPKYCRNCSNPDSPHKRIARKAGGLCKHCIGNGVRGSL
jgi:hypothetical protein